MIRRSISHVLLALLLLISQQMAITHVMSHWTGRIVNGEHAQAVQDEGGLSKSVAQDQSCGQCLAFAQIASAVGSSPRAFVSPDQQSHALPVNAAQSCAARTVCPFHSRAPPSLV